MDNLIEKSNVAKKMDIFNNTQRYLYKIDHYYNKDHDEYCLMIESDINKEDLAMITAGIQLIFEELVDESDCIDDQHLLEILKQFYGVKDIKDEYRKYLPQTQLAKSQWEMFNTFNIKADEIDDIQIIQIDLYEAREFNLARYYEGQLDRVLPDDIGALKDEIKNIRNFYPYLECK